jgi:hypothetical membrane protein
MNIPLAIFGAVLIVVGIIFIKTSIKSYKDRVKDTFGSVIRSLISGVGLVLIGIIVIIKAFNG